MSFQLTQHARLEMERRRISEQIVRQVLDNPEQVVPEREGLAAYQSRVATEDRGDMLVRVIVEERANPRRVVTVYRTSKIEKYWRQQ